MPSLQSDPVLCLNEVLKQKGATKDQAVFSQFCTAAATNGAFEIVTLCLQNIMAQGLTDPNLMGALPGCNERPNVVLLFVQAFASRRELADVIPCTPCSFYMTGCVRCTNRYTCTMWSKN